MTEAEKDLAVPSGNVPLAEPSVGTETYAGSPLIGFGMTSVVTGLIGLFLFVIPILAIPISVLGLAFGVVGLIGALWVGGQSLRWSLGGIVVCFVALTLNIAINQAPAGFVPAQQTPDVWQPPSPYPAPPPARPGQP